MKSLLNKLVTHYRTKRAARASRTIDLLTVKYQIFRGLLDSNDRAINLMSDLDLFSYSDSALIEQQDQIFQLIDAVDEMIELLNQLDTAFENLRLKFYRLRQQILDKIPSGQPVQKIPLIVPLPDVTVQMLPEIGNKAAALSALLQESEFNVPTGFVVPASVCREFLQQDNLNARINQQLRKFSPEDEIPLSAIESVQEMIHQADLPVGLEKAISDACLPFFESGKGLAVRSSSGDEDTASHSFAGQYDTVLNVVELPAALAAFRQVVASNFNARCLAYRQKVEMPRFNYDMAVLFIEMISARSAGVLLTRSPDAGPDRMLISGVYGLGESVVSGSSAADLYYLDRQGQPDHENTVIEKKQTRVVCSPKGGIAVESVPEDLADRPVLSEDELQTLFNWGKKLESLRNGPQDIEWAFNTDGTPILLQVRPLVSPGLKTNVEAEDQAGTQPAGEKTVSGQAAVIRNVQDLEKIPKGPAILLLQQSIADVARVIDRIDGILIEKGNPADHLALVAREYRVPVLSGLPDITSRYRDGDWLTIVETKRQIRAAEENEIQAAIKNRQQASMKPHRPATYQSGSLGELIFPLNLTDAYGPTFSIAECRSVHDIIRFTHEKAVLSMFDAGDYAIEKGGVKVHILDIDAPFIVNIIDLGGGLTPGVAYGKYVPDAAVQSYPLAALLQGVQTQELNWGPGPGGGAVGSVMSRWMTDQRSPRPIGMPNYAIITKDYLNLNARMDFHFTMIDSVCGFTTESNYIHFRFNGGGTSIAQRSRRARCIRLILEHNGFFTDIRNDLVNGIYQGGSPDTIREKLVVIGRLMGFTRLLDAAMKSDELVEAVADAFNREDYQLKAVQELGQA